MQRKSATCLADPELEKTKPGLSAETLACREAGEGRALCKEFLRRYARRWEIHVRGTRRLLQRQGKGLRFNLELYLHLQLRSALGPRVLPR